MSVYNPQDHIVQNKGTGVQGKPVDARSWWTDGIEERPFASIPEALAYFDLPIKRQGSFLVYVGDVPYWFKGGVEDADFVPFLTSTVDLTPVEGSTNPISSGWAYDMQLAAENGTGISYTNGALYANTEELKLNLDYFFGVWQAGFYQKGWIVLDIARTRVYKARVGHNSSVAPIPGPNWELLFALPEMDAIPVSNSDKYVRSGYLFEKEKEHLYYRDGKVYDAAGNEVLKVDTTAIAASTNAISSGYVFSQQATYAYWIGGVLRDIDGNPIPVGGPTYVHPATHPATMIVEDANNRFVTDAQIAYWNDHYTQAEVDNKVTGIAGGLIWKGAVPTFADLATTYPAPENNWTARVTGESKVYKYDTAAGAWLYIFDSADPLVTQTLDGNMSKADKIKLDGIAAGATQNATDTYLLSRGNHTGTQAISTVTGLEFALSERIKTVNSIPADVNGNAEVLAAHIDYTPNDTTWWGTGLIRIKGALDFLANGLKLLSLRVDELEGGPGGDGHTHTNKALLDTLTNTGDGTKALFNDGAYKLVSATGQVIDYLDAWLDVPAATNVVFDFIIDNVKRPNQKTPAAGTASANIADMPDGETIFLMFEDATGQTVSLPGGNHTDELGNPITSIKLPAAGDGTFVVNNVQGALMWSGTNETTEGNKTAEAASAAIVFTNPFGHVRSSALSGAQTFTTSGSLLAESVQPYTADGTAAINFSFTHKIMNSDFVSGGALAAGEYELYFSNRGTYVAISIATVGASAGGTTPPAPNTGITVTSPTYNTMRVTWQ